MNVIRFNYLRESENIEEVNVYLDLAGWRLVEIKKRRIGTDPSEPDFNDRLTYVLGYSEDLAATDGQSDAQVVEPEEEPGTKDMREMLRPPLPSAPTATDEGMPF